jgi:general secretion pathway protein K
MKQRGVALITAIVLVAIATVLAVHIGTRAALDLRRTTGLVALDQGWHVALGAEAWAAEVLSDDFNDNPEIDDLAEAWAQPLPPLPVDGGEVRGAVEDMQGRFNLNDLIDAEREVDEVSVGQFERLLVFVGAEPRWARMMADWIDANAMPEIPDGAEDATYLAQNPPYRTANVLVTTTTEMMALPGMTREQFERIRPYVAALPRGTKINLCTAKAPVLAALVEGGTDFGDADLLAANRKNGCFPTLADLQATVPQAEWQDTLSKRVSETSNWFRAVTAVRIGTSEFTLYSLLERNSAAGIRTVIRSTGNE